MTREEAIQKAERALNDPIAKGGGVALLELDHLRVLLEALRDPQPDPDTRRLRGQQNKQLDCVYERSVETWGKKLE